MKKLTPKQRRFCDEYLIDCNATQAAIRAGYSKKTANEQGAKLLNSEHISVYIEKQLEQMHNEKIVDAKEALIYLSSVMRGEQTDQVLRMVGGGVQEITEIQVSTKDRLKAAELIGKRYGMFKDNIGLDIEPVMIVDDLTE